MATTLADCFSKTYAINLPEREDRRRALTIELESQNFRPETRRLEIFAGVRPDSAEGFPNRGVRGCFLSHLGVLRRAMEERLESVLVLEDDVTFSPVLRERSGMIERELREQPWGFAYLGHQLELQPVPGRCLIPYTGDIVLAHCYGVRGSVLPKLVEFLESVPKRPAGHPDGGPMFPDGALSFFRARHPEIVTLAAAPGLAFQRSSRSDLTPRWFDRIPGLRETAGLLRSLRSR
jgi:glycosyl transferase, family 25